VRVRMSKTEEGYILVSKYVEEAESKTTKGESEEVSEKIETPKTETPKTETPKTETPKTETPGKET
ncbi:MAG: 50S ribosomal protein L31, partial [Nitrosopumilus sp.]|nr:50S ribosomal protein L31 [Nitrosopumilus sp.]